MKKFNPGKYISQGYYSSFQPERINRKWMVDDPEIISLLSRADREIGRLDMFSQYVPNIYLYISMHVAKEATESSKIEGTQTNLEETLLKEEQVSSEKRDDWEEVHNYIRAMNFAINDAGDLPLSTRLFRISHKILLDGVRGRNRMPGNFRTSQNWIGGASLKDARFIPPVQDTVPDLMGDLEKFIHNKKLILPDLLKIALIHYQFETIHPFLDGNGRMGRILIPLYLVRKGILKNPVLYLSEFLERNRQIYFDNLMGAREKGDLTQWFKFFLVGIIETAEKAVTTFDNILKLKERTDLKIQTLGSRAVRANLAMNKLFQKPVTDAALIAKATRLSHASVYKLIRDFERLGILTEYTGNQRGRFYLFQEYINLFN